MRDAWLKNTHYGMYRHITCTLIKYCFCGFHKYLYRCTWTAYQNKTTPTNVDMETMVSVYDKFPVVTFDIVYLKGLTKAADPDSDKGTLSTFPSFVVEAGSLERGWMTWSGSSEFVLLARP